MTQSDQFGEQVDYLPGGWLARRNNEDFDAVYNLASEHPLVSWLPAGKDALDSEFFQRKDVSWETFVDWQELRVLLASHPSGRNPALLEGAWGRGRFVLSSLWIDKCFDAQQQPLHSETATRIGEQFFEAVVRYVGLVKSGEAPRVIPTLSPADLAIGPMIGHVDSSSARLWYRPAPRDQHRDRWVCELRAEDGAEQSCTRTLDRDHDCVLHFDFEGLQPRTSHQFHIHPTEKGDGWTANRGATGDFQTASPPGTTDTTVVLGMGSCAPSTPSTVWTRILEEGCQGFVFLGDTPYIDSNQLKVAREKHRQFLSQPEISRMIARIPCWGTWDDHDFGRNDGHGDFSGKHVNRIAFTEYRANRSFGQDDSGSEQRAPFNGGRGIHTSFCLGALEVFLLDPRWFSRTESSWADPAKPTCLGRAQWEWLRDKLRASQAPFKAIATGMIWDDKTNSEKDDWGTYFYEREAIFDWIRNERIEGCFLVGGDIHVSRALNYGPRVGYDLWQFIVSPLHDRTIPSLNVQHPHLVHSAVEPHVFLRLQVDDARLTASWINRAGERIFEVELLREDLSW